MSNSNSSKLTLIPVMIAFFTMGFVDLVGAVSNNMQEDFGLSDSAANFFPSLVFFWFLIFSVPTGMLMNKIGRKKTVLLSIIITTLAVFLPLFDSFMPTKESQLWLMYISFSLLGIGNAIMQTSINPLVTMLVKGHLASTLTFGQFVKAIASFIAPLIAAWGATTTAPIFGLSWRILFLLFFVVGMIATLWLGMTSIEEEPIEGKASGFVDCLKMLGSPSSCSRSSASCAMWASTLVQTLWLLRFSWSVWVAKATRSASLNTPHPYTSHSVHSAVSPVRYLCASSISAPSSPSSCL